MTDEIIKLYENAEVEKPCTRPKDLICATFRPDGLYRCTNGCYNCIYLGDCPPFTAEKQLSLIIFLSYKYGKGLLINLRTIDKVIDIYDFELFGECLAKLVNKLWQSLTSEEKQQIKEILE